MDKFPLRSFCAHAISSQFLDAPFPSLQYLRFAITITTRSTSSPSHGLSLSPHTIVFYPAFFLSRLK